MPAPNGNKNAAGQRVERERIKVDLSLSKKNGLLALASQHLLNQGMEATDKQIRELASQWFYAQFGEWLNRQIEVGDSAIIL